MMAFFQNAPVNKEIPLAEAETVHIHLRRDIFQKCGDGSQRDVSGPFMWIKVMAGADAGESNTAKAIIPGKRQRPAVRLRQQSILAFCAYPEQPAGTDSVDNTATEQSSWQGENRSPCPGFTISPDVAYACGQKFRSGCTVYGTAYATTMMQPGTGGVHDSITAETGDIAFSDIQHNPGFSS